MKNKGETLIESLLSMFFITIILLPVSNILLKTYKLDEKINKLNIEILDKKNMLEIIKNKNNKELEQLEGEYILKTKEEFYNLFSVSKNYELINENFDKNIKIKIVKIKENNEDYNMLNSNYNFKIFIDELEEGIYFK